MNRRDFLKLSAFTGASLALPGCTKAYFANANDRPNILFIAIDDLRPELGCYGDKFIKTPSIDQLAKSGVVFNHAYCQQAVCNPSRASLLTGMRPDTARVWDLRVHFRENVPEVVTLPQHFKENGYYTVGIGKIYHGVSGHMEDPLTWSVPKMQPKVNKSWDKWELPDEIVQQREDLKAKLLAEGKTQQQVDRIRASATACEDVLDNERYDGAQTDAAVEKLAQLKDQSTPFFLAVGYIRPHLPFNPPKKYWDMYDRESIPLAANDFLPKDAPPVAMNTMYELRDYMDFLGTPAPDQGELTEQQQRLLKHGYYACVSFIDAQVGRLMDALDKSGLRDNTIVVLWGDHGWKLGEHRSWCKQTNYEIDTRVPLIVSAPQAKSKGTKSDALVEFIDIYPTLCELADLKKPSHLEGLSFKPLMDDPTLTWKQGAFSQFLRRHQGVQYLGHSIRTSRYRFVEWRDCHTGKIHAVELYDHKDDPQENYNIANRDQNKALVAKLAKQLRQTCPALPPGTVVPQKRSAKSDKRVSIEIINKFDEPTVVYWLGFYGERHTVCSLKPGQKHTLKTSIGHLFKAVSQSGRKTMLFKIQDDQQQPVVIK